MRGLLIITFAALVTACATRPALLTVYPELRAIPETSWCEARGGLPREAVTPDENGQSTIKVVGCDILPHTSAEDQRVSIRRWLVENGKAVAKDRPEVR